MHKSASYKCISAAGSEDAVALICWEVGLVEVVDCYY